MCRQEEFPASGGDFRAGVGNGRIHFVQAETRGQISNLSPKNDINQNG